MPSGLFSVVGVHLSWRKTKEAQHEWSVMRSLRATVQLDKAESSAHIAHRRHSNCSSGFSGVRGTRWRLNRMISALKIVTSLIKGNKFGVVVRGY